MVSQRKLRTTLETPRMLERDEDGNIVYPRTRGGGTGDVYTYDEARDGELPAFESDLPQNDDESLSPAAIALMGAAIAHRRDAEGAARFEAEQLNAAHRAAQEKGLKVPATPEHPAPVGTSPVYAMPDSNEGLRRATETARQETHAIRGQAAAEQFARMNMDARVQNDNAAVEAGVANATVEARAANATVETKAAGVAAAPVVEAGARGVLHRAQDGSVTVAGAKVDGALVHDLNDLEFTGTPWATQEYYSGLPLESPEEGDTGEDAWYPLPPGEFKAIHSEYTDVVDPHEQILDSAHHAHLQARGSAIMARQRRDRALELAAKKRAAGLSDAQEMQAAGYAEQMIARAEGNDRRAMDIEVGMRYREWEDQGRDQRDKQAAEARRAHLQEERSIAMQQAAATGMALAHGHTPEGGIHAPEGGILAPEGGGPAPVRGETAPRAIEQITPAHVAAVSAGLSAASVTNAGAGGMAAGIAATATGEHANSPAPSNAVSQGDALAPPVSQRDSLASPVVRSRMPMELKGPGTDYVPGQVRTNGDNAADDARADFAQSVGAPETASVGAPEANRMGVPEAAVAGGLRRDGVAANRNAPAARTGEPNAAEAGRAERDSAAGNVNAAPAVVALEATDSKANNAASEYEDRAVERVEMRTSAGSMTLPAAVSVEKTEFGTSYVFVMPPAAREAGFDASVVLGTDDGSGTGLAGIADRAWSLSGEVEAAIREYEDAANYENPTIPNENGEQPNTVPDNVMVTPPDARMVLGAGVPEDPVLAAQAYMAHDMEAYNARNAAPILPGEPDPEMVASTNPDEPAPQREMREAAHAGLEPNFVAATLPPLEGRDAQYIIDADRATHLPGGGTGGWIAVAPEPEGLTPEEAAEREELLRARHDAEKAKDDLEEPEPPAPK